MTLRSQDQKDDDIKIPRPKSYDIEFLPDSLARLPDIQTRCFPDARQLCKTNLNLRLSGRIRVRIPQELDVLAFWSWSLDFVVFWSRNLDVGVFWSWSPDVVVYVPPPPRFCYNHENKKNTQLCLYIVEKYFDCPNLCNIYLHNVCINE